MKMVIKAKTATMKLIKYGPVSYGMFPTVLYTYYCYVFYYIVSSPYHFIV